MLRFAAGRAKFLMQKIVINTLAGQLSAELISRGVATDARTRVVIELLDDRKIAINAKSVARRDQDWLVDEPDLYDDSDLVELAD